MLNSSAGALWLRFQWTVKGERRTKRPLALLCRALRCWGSHTSRHTQSTAPALRDAHQHLLWLWPPEVRGELCAASATKRVVTCFGSTGSQSSHGVSVASSSLNSQCAGGSEVSLPGTTALYPAWDRSRHRHYLSPIICHESIISSTWITVAMHLS